MPWFSSFLSDRVTPRSHSRLSRFLVPSQSGLVANFYSHSFDYTEVRSLLRPWGKGFHSRNNNWLYAYNCTKVKIQLYCQSPNNLFLLKSKSNYSDSFLFQGKTCIQCHKSSPFRWDRMPLLSFFPCYIQVRASLCHSFLLCLAPDFLFGAWYFC